MTTKEIRFPYKNFNCNSKYVHASFAKYIHPLQPKPMENENCEDNKNKKMLFRQYSDKVVELQDY